MSKIIIKLYIPIGTINNSNYSKNILSEGRYFGVFKLTCMHTGKRPKKNKIWNDIHFIIWIFFLELLLLDYFALKMAFQCFPTWFYFHFKNNSGKIMHRIDSSQYNVLYIAIKINKIERNKIAGKVTLEGNCHYWDIQKNHVYVL